MMFTENSSGALTYMTAPNLSAVHAFTTRRGGVSGGIYDSLNLRLSLGDAPENVRQNYGILGAALCFDPEKLVMNHQVHGTTIRLVSALDRQSLFAPVPDADGLITADREVPLFVFTADCVPILLEDPVRGAIGAVHAGWRGTAADIAGVAVREMTAKLGCRPENIRAAIGPCISQCCFETGDDVVLAVRALMGSAADRYVMKSGNRHHVDLKGINGFLLRQAGLIEDNIQASDECTSCLGRKYWSHRATGGKRGSQAAVIMLHQERTTF
jgi:YfiH family protein